MENEKIKCHNCINGKVDGGFQKRVIKELNNLEIKKKFDLSNLKEKNKEKLIELKKQINYQYSKLIENKEKEEPYLISKCFKCKGRGFKY